MLFNDHTTRSLRTRFLICPIVRGCTTRRLLCHRSCSSAYTYDNQYPVKGDEPDTFLWRSGMMGAWQIDPTDTARWTEAQRHATKRSVQIYKEWIRPILQDVKVHHILPRPDGIHWDGLFYWSPSLRRGTLYACRPESLEQRQTVRLKGLKPEGTYWLWCEDGSIAPGVRGGKQLMEQGLVVSLPQPYTSDLIFLQDKALGKPRGLKEPGEFRLKSAETTASPFTVSATFRWEPGDNATSYRVMVSEEVDFSRLVGQAVTSGQTVTLVDLLPRNVSTGKWRPYPGAASGLMQEVRGNCSRRRRYRFPGSHSFPTCHGSKLRPAPVTPSAGIGTTTASQSRSPEWSIPRASGRMHSPIRRPPRS